MSVKKIIVLFVIGVIFLWVGISCIKKNVPDTYIMNIFPLDEQNMLVIKGWESKRDALFKFEKAERYSTISSGNFEDDYFAIVDRDYYILSSKELQKGRF